MNMRVLVLFLGIIMISSTISVSSSDALLPLNIPDVSQAPEHVKIIEGENLIAYARALYTSLDNPSNHVVPTIDPHDGVAKLRLVTTDGIFGCSGTLASDRLHIITAAHCVTDLDGNYILTSGSAKFEGNSESVTLLLDAANSVSHPNYDGDYIKGNDIAILKLETTAPVQIPGIPYAKSGSAVDTVVDKNGYGYSGYFSSGTDKSTYPFGIERNGQNKYDAFADTMYVALGLTPNEEFIPEAIYQYDSDDGSSSHDAFGFFFGIRDTGFDNEVLSAPGDSGGPTILNGELVGVTSYGISLHYTRGPPPRTSDCTNQLDSSCGEFAGDTRVSHYANFIASVLNTVNNEEPVSPITLVSITVSPDNTSITKDSTQQFTVTGTYSDSTSQVLTVVTWSSSDSNVATIDGTGLATGISVGLVTITANSGGLTDTTSLDVTAASEEPTTVSVSSVTYSGEGGKNSDKHLLITIALLDNLGDPVSGASVSITLKNIDTGGSWSGTATTGSDGSITFSLKNAPSGCYTTTVTDVTASDLTWDDATPANEECKQQTNNAKNSTPSVIKSKN